MSASPLAKLSLLLLKEIRMKIQNRYLDDFSQIDWGDKFINLARGLSRPLIEVGYGIKTKSMPTHYLIWITNFLALGILFHIDRYVFNHVHFGFFKLSYLYPHKPILYWPYVYGAITSPFWVWGARQAWERRKLANRLTDVFTTAGLKNALGKFPNFICDVPIDEFTRKLRVTRANFSKKSFDEAKDYLASSLQVFIDEIKEEREKGIVDIIYSQIPMPTFVELDNLMEIGPLQIVIGKTRSQLITVSLKNVPHFILGGQTGGGKSTSIRGIMTTLYLNNPNMEFSLIDLKGGLEFQLFESLPRVEVIPSLALAVGKFEILKKDLDTRMELLKTYNCKDLESYEKIRELKIKQVGHKLPVLKRHVVIIDEAAELFLSGGGVDNSQIQIARRILSQIARQGRSVGFTLIVATQRPDARALDPQVKANLPGVICFQMLNDSSSITVLGNGRATDLPSVPGRAIWKTGSEMMEVQTPFLSFENAERLLEPYRIKKPNPNGQPTKPETASLTQPQRLKPSDKED